MFDTIRYQICLFVVFMPELAKVRWCNVAGNYAGKSVTSRRDERRQLLIDNGMALIGNRGRRAGALSAERDAPVSG